MITYSKQTIIKKDIDAVSKVLRSNFLTQGPKVPQFENKVKKFIGSKYCLAVNSASSGLYVACKALNLKKKDIVWTVTNSFVATANCIVLNNYKIDFVDIDKSTWNISLENLKNKLIKAKKQKKTPKALIVVHLAGLPVDPIELKRLSNIYKFKIIEDAAHSIGSTYYGKKVGCCKWSDITVFSFHPVKIITTAEGGCIATNNKIFFERMKLTRNNGITREKKFYKNKNLGDWYYEQQSLGFNFRMNDLQAALGISQLGKINYFIKKRNKIANVYKKKLKNLPLTFQKIGKNFSSSYHLFIIKINIDDKLKHKRLFDLMRRNNIFVNLHYLPIHLHPYYQKLGFRKNDFPNSEDYSNKSMSIPIYPSLSKKNMQKVINILKKFFKKFNEKKN